MNLKRTVAIVLAMIVLIMAFSSCTRRIIDFTVISSKNTEMTIPASSKGERVIGKDTTPIILFPIGYPSMKEACDRAIESAGPQYDALIDGVVYFKVVAFIFGMQQYIVEGTPVISNQINSAMGPRKTNEMAMIYHSKTGKNNDEAIKKMPIRELK